MVLDNILGGGSNFKWIGSLHGYLPCKRSIQTKKVVRAKFGKGPNQDFMKIFI
ncbi:MAG: hypothetical protein CM15mP62_29670 [Rhodospirillaceae bacterium]|nr:MAG: hypothetical protein CM15mP62_29670 [Rhodospirillaceae bacterium]